MSERKVQLVFPRSTDGEPMRGYGDKMVEGFATSAKEIAKWFKDFQVESITITLGGVVETGGVLRLIVSTRGEGWVSLILKPKDSALKDNDS
jgi:hypothetical protein